MSKAEGLVELALFAGLLALAGSAGWHLNARVAPHPVAELRDLARVRDRVDGREESADERRVQALYGMDVLGWGDRRAERAACSKNSRC